VGQLREWVEEVEREEGRIFGKGVVPSWTLGIDTQVQARRHYSVRADSNAKVKSKVVEE
jgi:hypothetical protein